MKAAALLFVLVFASAASAQEASRPMPPPEEPTPEQPTATAGSQTEDLLDDGVEMEAPPRDAFVQTGLVALEENRLQDALDAFNRALALEDEPTVHLHLARTYERMADSDHAIAEYEVFLASNPPADAPATVDAQAALERLRPPPPVEEVEPEPEPEPEVVLDVPAPAPDPEPLLDPAVLVLGATTTAVLLAAAVCGIMALDAEHEFERGVAQVEAATDDMAADRARMDALDAASRADDFALVSDVLFGAAIVGAGVTAIVALTGDDEEAPRVTPAIGTTSIGARVSGSF